MSTSKSFKCQACGITQQVIGFFQKEINYYKIILETNQMDNLHSDREIIEQGYFCLNCNQNINKKGKKLISIKSVTFNITKEEVQELFSEMIVSGIFKKNKKLSNVQIKKTLDCVECDEFLAKDIRNSIKDSILYVLSF